MISINLTGRLTREPELRQVSNGATGEPLDVCQLRVAPATAAATPSISISPNGAPPVALRPTA